MALRSPVLPTSYDELLAGYYGLHHRRRRRAPQTLEAVVGADGRTARVISLSVDDGEIIPQSALPTAKREEYVKGATLYRPGDPAEDFYVLDSGRVEFLVGRGERTAPGGFMLKKGEVFGWAALLDGYPIKAVYRTDGNSPRL